MSSERPGWFAYGGLERLIHEKARLSIVASLANHPQGLPFNDLKQLCSLTDDNLSRRLQLLEQAGIVEVWKGYKDRRPQTLCRLSGLGRQRFVEYMEELERVVGITVHLTFARRAYELAEWHRRRGAVVVVVVVLVVEAMCPNGLDNLVVPLVGFLGLWWCMGWRGCERLNRRGGDGRYRPWGIRYEAAGRLKNSFRCIRKCLRLSGAVLL